MLSSGVLDGCQRRSAQPYEEVPPSHSITLALLSLPDFRAGHSAIFVPCENQHIRKGLLDHLVGAGEERRGHGEDERRRVLDADDQFCIGRSVEGQIGRVLPL